MTRATQKDTRLLPALALLAAVWIACRPTPAPAPAPVPAPAPAPQSAWKPLRWQDVASMPVPPADHRIRYGSDPLQFGDLRLPPGPGPHPVVVMIHGGCWLSDYDLEHVGNLSAALARAGFATWTLEYRRVGNDGGGWPGTFQDVALGTDYVRTLAQKYPLDSKRVVLMGHSAGGQLALWLAARKRLPEGSPLRSAEPLEVRGVVSLAGIADLRAYAAGKGGCNSAAPQLMGGGPEQVPERYAQVSPIELLPLGVPVRLVHGSLDAIVPLEQSRAYEARAKAAGDDAQLWTQEGVGHFDLVSPRAPSWPEVERAVESLLGR
jgi:acetyl esterase/lipase